MFEQGADKSSLLWYLATQPEQGAEILALEILANLKTWHCGTTGNASKLGETELLKVDPGVDAEGVACSAD